jgi:hypothetical protein
LDKCDAKEVQLNSWPRVIYDRSAENSNTHKVVTADELGLANSIKLAKQVEGRFSKVKPSMMMDCKPIPCYSLRIQEKQERTTQAKLNAIKRKEIIAERKKKAEISKSIS